jgi:hypothetical protein
VSFPLLEMVERQLHCFVPTEATCQ